METQEQLQKLHDLTHQIQKAPIIPHSFYILGAGQFGSTAIQYALSQPDSPYILVVDKEIKSSNDLLKDFIVIKEYYQVLFTNTIKKYYLQRDISIISENLKFGFPEYLIPAVPIHAIALILTHLLSFLKSEFDISSRHQKEKWKELLGKIPKDVILKSDPECGVILISWAKHDQICPPNCPAPADYCPYHKREKPLTITQISKDIQLADIRNFTLESHQVQPGLGLLWGNELKNTLINILNFIIERKKMNLPASFFVSTCCNCHGVLNVFTIE